MCFHIFYAIPIVAIAKQWTRIQCKRFWAKEWRLNLIFYIVSLRSFVVYSQSMFLCSNSSHKIVYFAGSGTASSAILFERLRADIFVASTRDSSSKLPPCFFSNICQCIQLFNKHWHLQIYKKQYTTSTRGITGASASNGLSQRQRFQY